MEENIETLHKAIKKEYDKINLYNAWDHGYKLGLEFVLDLIEMMEAEK